MDDVTPGAASAGPVAERMQALLSRAVEEQVGEQRIVSAILTDLRGEVAKLTGQVAGMLAPDPQQIADLVQQRLSDQLVENMSVRVADLVLTQVRATLVHDLGDLFAAKITEVAGVVRSASADSEGRVLAHIDEAVLALAEALLRPRRNGRGGGAAEPIDAVSPGPGVPGPGVPGPGVPGPGVPGPGVPGPGVPGPGVPGPGVPGPGVPGPGVPEPGEAGPRGTVDSAAVPLGRSQVDAPSTDQGRSGPAGRAGGRQRPSTSRATGRPRRFETTHPPVDVTSGADEGPASSQPVRRPARSAADVDSRPGLDRLAADGPLGDGEQPHPPPADGASQSTDAVVNETADGPGTGEPADEGPAATRSDEPASRRRPWWRPAG